MIIIKYLPIVMKWDCLSYFINVNYMYIFYTMIPSLHFCGKETKKNPKKRSGREKVSVSYVEDLFF